MKKILMLLLIIFLGAPTSPLTAVYDEERGQDVPTLSCSAKLLQLLGNLSKETRHWAGNHKKSVALSTLGICALATIYYKLTFGDIGISPIDPCTFNSDGIFDMHACIDYLESSVDTSTYDLFLASAQEKAADLCENVSDPEKLQEALTQIWDMLQSNHCHIHDEL